MSYPLQKFIDIAVSRYSLSRRSDPLIREVRKVLFDGYEDVIIGTYDHLRSPFSNRLVTSDIRFSSIAASIETRCVTLLLDMTMTPIKRRHRTARGDRIGVHVFSRDLARLDRLLTNPHQYLSFQTSLAPIRIGQIELIKYFRDPVVTHLLQGRGVRKRQAQRIAEVMTQRAEHVINAYCRTLQDCTSEETNASERLLAVRNRIWEMIGLNSYLSRIERIPISRFQKRIAQSLCMLEGFQWFRRFLKGSHKLDLRLLEYIDRNGCENGSIYCSDGSNNFEIRHASPNRITKTVKGWDGICSLVDSSQAFPTTHLLYLLLHLAAGYPHFGNSYGMNNDLCEIMGISARPFLDITDDNVNSIDVDLITIPMGVTAMPQRNVTIDLIWYGIEAFRHKCINVAETGKSIGRYDFSEHLPDMN